MGEIFWGFLSTNSFVQLREPTIYEEGVYIGSIMLWAFFQKQKADKNVNKQYFDYIPTIIKII